MDLLERAEPLAQLHATLANVSGGDGRLVLLAGEAGVGKSSLVRQFCQDVRTAARILSGACDPLSTPRPLGPLYDIAGEVGGELLEAVRGGEDRERLFRAFLDEITRPSPRAAVVVVEDVHWADDATLDLMRYLGRRLSAGRTLLLLTYRDEEIGPNHPLRVLLGDLVSTSSTTRVNLHPLTLDSVRRMASNASIEPDVLFQQTHGNPFYLTEVIASGSSELPATVRDAVLARAARLSSSARQALDASSIIGAPIDIDLLIRTANVDTAAIEECLVAGMLRVEGAGLEFRHEIARRAVAESISSSRLRMLHATVLDVLRSGVAGPQHLAQLAHHAELAHDREAVLQYATAAGRAASRLRAHREAAAQFARALRFANDLPDLERARLLEERAHECYLIDQIDDAITARLTALRLYRQIPVPISEGENLRWLSRLYWFSGDRERAEEFAKAALDVLEPLGDHVQLARAYSNMAQVRMLADDTAGAVAWGERAIALATSLHDDETIVHALNNIGSARWNIGDERGRVELEESLSLALGKGLDEHAARAWTNLAAPAVCWHRFDLAERYLSDALSYCLENDLGAWGRYMSGWKAMMLCAQGAWMAATTSAEEVLTALDHSSVSRIMPLIVLGRVRARRGDPDVWVALDEAWRLAVLADEGQRLCPVAAARIEAASLGGDSKLIESTLVDAKSAVHAAPDPWIRGELACWIQKMDKGFETNEVVAEPYVLGSGGDVAAAAEAWLAVGCPYEAARALSDGDVDELQQAYDIFERLGAAPMVARVSRALRDHGIVRIKRGPRSSTLANPAGMTQRETEVADLIAEGLTNGQIAERLFLSPKTVERHVSGVFGKLGVERRAEVGRAMRELTLRE